MAGGGGGGQADQGGEKNTYYILWVIALIIFVGVVVWYLADYQLKVFFIALRKYELLGIYYIVNALPLESIPFAWVHDLPGRLAADLDLVQQISPATLSMPIAEALSIEVGDFLKYPVAILLACLAIYVYRSHILVRYVKRHNMKTLLQQEQQNWPQIKIVEKLNLLEQDLDSGPWAMAMTPMQFAKKYQLISVRKAKLVGSGFSKMPEAEFKVEVDKARAERVFAAQLGRPWQNVDVLLPHRRAITAILMARGSRDTKAAQNMVAQLATSAGDGKLDFNGIDDLLKKHVNNSQVQKIIKAHAYEFTVIASLLMYAREDGVMASADFLWVKPIDRRLWYVLNCVGRQTPAVEVGGIFCHWFNELALKRPLSVPVVETAVEALEIALSDIIYQADDKEREEIAKREQETSQPTVEHSE